MQSLQFSSNGRVEKAHEPWKWFKTVIFTVKNRFNKSNFRFMVNQDGLYFRSWKKTVVIKEKQYETVA